MRVLSPCPLAAVLLFVAGCAPGVGLPGVSQSADLQAVVNHRWWKVRPTAAQVEGWAQKLSESKAGTVFYADQDGKAAWESNGKLGYVPGNRPKTIGDPYIYVEVNPEGVRYMTRAEALAELRARLDRAEFQGR